MRVGSPSSLAGSTECPSEGERCKRQRPTTHDHPLPAPADGEAGYRPPATDWTRIGRMDEARLCVLCRKHRRDERWRPFCSERCRNEDLARWAEGRYRVAGEPVPDEDRPADEDADD